jgi:hypothetical protein
VDAHDISFLVSSELPKDESEIEDINDFGVCTKEVAAVGALKPVSTVSFVTNNRFGSSLEVSNKSLDILN